MSLKIFSVHSDKKNSKKEISLNVTFSFVTYIMCNIHDTTKDESKLINFDFFVNFKVSRVHREYFHWHIIVQLHYKIGA